MPATDANEGPDARRFNNAVFAASVFVSILWAVKLAELALATDFTHYGNYPGHPDPLRGILLGPLIHGSWSHLISNTAPLIVLGTALLYGYPRSARFVIPFVYLGSGIGVWLFARSSYHIGASGLTFGMMFFVLSIGALRWDRRAIALAMIAFLLYGGMIWGIFPSDPRISFESHLFGAAISVVTAFVFKNYDPAAAEKRYSWEDGGDDGSEHEDDGSARP